MAQTLIDELRAGAKIDRVLELYDGLDTLPIESIKGDWKGEEVDTGHAMQGLLEAIDWQGKRFDGLGNAHPLILGRNKRFAIKPLPFLLWLSIKVALFRRPFMRPINSLIARTIQTRKYQAQVRMVEYRGKSSASMIYDGVPIIDHFRKIDDNTILGIMDFKWISEPYAFMLRKEQASA